MKSDLSVKIKKLQNEDLSDFIELVRLFEEVFELKDFKIPDLKHLQRLFDREDFHVFVAKSKGLVVGGLTVYILEQYYSTKPSAYIFDLAVDTKFQGRGIGISLIAAATSCYEEKGFEEVLVQADQIVDYGIDFYRKTIPTKWEEVRHFYYQLN